MIKAIFFDLGGVVFTDFYTGGEVELSEDLNISPKTVLDAFVKTDVPAYCRGELTDEERWKTFTQKLGLPDNKVQLCLDGYYKSYQLISETFKFLIELKKTKKYQLGVLSDQPSSVARYLRETYPEVFVIFDPELVIISAEVKSTKKDPNYKIFYKAIERSRVVPEQIFFIDNAIHNIEAAKKVNMGTYFFDIKTKDAEDLVKDLQSILITSDSDS